MLKEASQRSGPVKVSYLPGFEPSPRITTTEIEAAKTPRGGWTKETLASWGVPWPPPKGWREQIEIRDQKRPSQPRPMTKLPFQATINGESYIVYRDGGEITVEPLEEEPEWWAAYEQPEGEEFFRDYEAFA
jgi:hypothetical protein